MAEHGEVSRSTGLRLIAVLKLLKGLVLLAVGVGALKLLHHDVGEAVLRWVNVLRVDPDNRLIHRVLMKLWFVDDRTLARVSAGTFFYAGLLLTEGAGLWLARPWAKYLAIILTASLLPLEAYELLKHFSLTKVLAIAVNLAVVWYLVARLTGEHRQKAG